MCWIGNKCDKRIADKDITVYKVLQKSKAKIPGEFLYRAPFRTEFRYVIGGKYSKAIKEKIIDNNLITIESGLHCFEQYAYVICNDYKTIYVSMSFDDDRWSFEATKSGYTPVIVKCIIPKGTIYYKNIHKEIVTEKLIIKEDLGTPIGFVGFLKDL